MGPATPYQGNVHITRKSINSALLCFLEQFALCSCPDKVTEYFYKRENTSPIFYSSCNSRAFGQLHVIANSSLLCGQGGLQSVSGRDTDGDTN